MRISQRILCLLLTAIVPALATSDSAAAPKPVVVAVSDSLTNNQPTNWLAVFDAMRPDLRTVAEAHGGWTTKSYFKEKFDGVAWASLPKYAVCGFSQFNCRKIRDDILAGLVSWRMPRNVDYPA